MGMTLNHACLRAEWTAADHEAAKKFRSMAAEALGRFGEAVWKRVLLASGVRYIPLADIQDGGAPMAVGNGNKIILPDLDCAAQTWVAFVEAKAKTQSIEFRMKRQVRHGINESNYLQYKKAAEEYRKRCAVAIVELWHADFQTWSGRLLFERIDNLGQPFQEYREKPPKVYWQTKQFCDLDSFTPAELVAIANGGECPSYGHEFDLIFNRRIQGDLF